MHKEVINQTEFTFMKVDSPDLLNEVFRIRYQVYCKECNFIKDEDYPEGIEKDNYDAHSLHFLAKDSNGLIGAARLILDCPLGFPLEEHCNGHLTIDKNSLPRKRIAEISRLVISRGYRRRREDGLYYTTDCLQTADITPIESMRRIRPMTFGIYREIYQESKRRGITHWYALMEKTLWLLLRLHGFNFQAIGEEIDFYGSVQPYLADISKIERECYEKHPQSFQYFMQGLEPEYQPSL